MGRYCGALMLHDYEQRIYMEPLERVSLHGLIPGKSQLPHDYVLLPRTLNGMVLLRRFDAIWLRTMDYLNSLIRVSLQQSRGSASCKYIRQTYGNADSDDCYVGLPSMISRIIQEITFDVLH